MPVFCLFAVTAAISNVSSAEDKSAPGQDTLILANGDTLHGTLVREVSGKVTFHSDALGDVTVPWKNVKELHSSQRFGILQKNVTLRRKHALDQIPSGAIDVADQSVTLHPQSGAAPGPIPVNDANYIVDYSTLDTQLNHEPSFLSGWNGSATAGATLVQATQNQYTVSGALSLARAVPSVSWLPPRNRSLFDFTGSYGKLTQPGTPSVKSAIYHVDGERDQYISSRLYGLAQVAFDHNYAQNLQLQQIYGGGMGWTIFNTPRHQADVKATLQYEKQEFIAGGGGTTQQLIGSTFAANYMLHTSYVVFAQSLAYIPAYNNPSAYSANETNTISFPAYKRFSFSVGTIDSYLNDPPAVIPPTKRNSFQLTMGLSFSINSKY